MKRGSTGRHEIAIAGGETVRAFVPAALPPSPPIVLDDVLTALLAETMLAVGRLDAMTTMLRDVDLLLYAYVRKEAVVSSQIEGTQSSLSDLLLFELEEATGVPIDDVVETSNYVAAMDHGLFRLREGFPVSNRLLREIHGVLLSSGRGRGKDPGNFRRSQNWIGGTRPGNARFVPPPAELVDDAMSALERFLHDERPLLPPIIRAALAHVQFETIHPFLDGNGRVGRLLITLLLCDCGILSKPLLYLSLYFKQHRARYYALLDQVRQDGDWEAWLAFFLEGVRETANGAVVAARRLLEIFAEDRRAIELQGRRASTGLRVHDVLQMRPLVRIRDVAQRGGIEIPTATKGLHTLAELGIVREITGFKRNRIYVYSRYLDVLNEGAEPL